MNLRPYQSEAIEQVEGAIALGSTEICLGAPTSFGKTVTSGHFIKEQVEQGKSIVFMMNLTALIEQTINMLKSLDIPFKVIAAEFDGQEFDHQAKVTVCMQQTLYARMNKIKVPECDILIVDEFHISFRTKTMEEVKQWLKPDVIFGLSATPYDERGYTLKNVDIIQTTSIKDLTKQGYLTPLKVFSVKFAEEVDLTQAGAGEYTENFLNEQINTPGYIKKTVEAWEKTAQDLKTIVFTTGIEHSIALAKEWKNKGYNFEAYHSKLTKKEAKRIMDLFKSNKIQGLVSVNKVLVGFDDPSIKCGVACRPTRTRRVWQQACGRLIRLFENKENALLLDCAQWTAEHGFIDEPYNAPEAGDKNALKTAKEAATVKVVELILNEEEPTIITRTVAIEKIEELERKAKKIPELKMKDLIAIYNTSVLTHQIIEVAYEINRRKKGQTYTEKNILFVSKLWDIMIEDYPQFKSRILKTLKTMSKNKVAQGKKISALHYTVGKLGQPGIKTVGWLREQTPYYKMEVPDSNDITEEEQNAYNAYDHIDEDEIPF